MRKVLLIQGARFGDIVQTERLILSLLPKYEVHLCIDTGLSELAQILYPKVLVHVFNFHAANGNLVFSELLEHGKELRQIEFEKVINCNFSPLTTALCRLFPEETVIGYRPAKDSSGGILRSPWIRLAMRLSKTRYLTSLNLVDYWANFIENPVSPLDVNPVSVQGTKILGITLSGRESRRSLPMPILANIVKIIFQLMREPEIILLGTSSENKYANQLMRDFTPKMFSRTKNLSGQTNWTQLVNIVGSLDLLITPDTGLMHLAAKLGRQVMAFFLSSAWAHETGPYGQGHIIWQSACDCSPCLESGSCPHNLDCLAPYKAAGFSRALVEVYKNEPVSDMPPNLQCWSTNLDDLGTYLKLTAGEDKYEDTRLVVRALLKQYLHLEHDREIVLSESERNLLIPQLFPDSEWMLPPWRYC